MNRAFLDTHVALWLAIGGGDISAAAIRAIESFGSRSISALSFVELQLKADKGARLPNNIVDRFMSVGIQIENFDVHAAGNFSRFGALRGTDPFDRMLLAQAATVPGTVFFTADERLLALGFDWIVDARG